jgi:ParB-like chromosome segregation protein Spo0J
MIIEQIPIDRINPAPYNPRLDLRPGEPLYEKIRRSIEEFDLVEPLVWNKRTGNLVGGHQRLKVLKAQGLKEVQCAVVDLPLEREKILNLALNKALGDWDEPKLADVLGELNALADINSEIDLDMTGFDETERDYISSIMEVHRDLKANEREIDSFKTTNKCPKCGYEW